MPLLELYGKNPDGAIDKRVIAGMTGWIIFFPTDTPPDGTLVCNGAELSTSAYPELYGAIGTKYGGNGTATFRLPKAEDVIYAAGARHAVGEAVSEGLPDVTGTIASRSYSISDGNMIWASNPGSAFFDYPVIYEGDGAHVAGASGAPGYDRVGFSAAKSNSIYGASAHVTPAGIALLPCIVYI